MHRKVRKDDVSEYSTGEPSEDLETETDEEVQYRSGRMERSSGNVSAHLVNSTDSDLDNDSIALLQTFAASGSYIMELQTCRRVSKTAYRVHTKKIRFEMGHDSKEEDLKAIINKSKLKD